MPQGQVSAQAEPQVSVDDVGDPAVQRYTPYGETRGSETVDVPYQFTGQRNEASIGLYHYGARWYDPALGRFIQADTIVPQPEDPQSLNRYAYVYNNPLKYTDPSGRWVETALDIAGIAFDIYQIRQEGWTTVNTISLVVDVGCLLLPFAAGGGMLVRAATKVDDIADTAKVVNATDLAKATNVVENAVDAADKAADIAKLTPELTYLERFGIQPVADLRRSGDLALLRDSGKRVHVHHAIERRFVDQLNVAEWEIPGIVLTPKEHNIFTQRWRNYIAYNGTRNARITTASASRADIRTAVEYVYRDYPDIANELLAWLDALPGG